MEIGTQIRKYRTEKKLSQDELAEKIYVSRQTISNWENDKNYPDIKSLLLLSALFDISLDTLVKGDLEKMKEQINAEDIRQFNRDGNIFTILLAATILTAVPLALLWNFWGLGIWAVIAIICLIYAHRIEKQKKQYSIQTFKEIVAFTEGRALDELEKAEERAKFPYQKAWIVLGCCLITLSVTIGMAFLLVKVFHW